MPQWERSEFQYRAAEKCAEISVFENRLILCPVGRVLRYNKQGLCVPQKSQSQPKSADSFGGAAPNPPKGEMCMGKDIRIAVRVTAKEKEKIQSKARKCGLRTTEYVKQRALGYEPREVPPVALLFASKSWASLRIKPVHWGWTRKLVRC